MRLLVAFSLPGVFLYMVLVSLSFICRALFPPAQFIIRVLFFFAEFISSCAKRGSGAGPGDWQHTTCLASECQVGSSRSAVSSSCPGQGHQPAPWGGGAKAPVIRANLRPQVNPSHPRNRGTNAKCHSGTHLHCRAGLQKGGLPCTHHWKIPSFFWVSSRQALWRLMR